MLMAMVAFIGTELFISAFVGGMLMKHAISLASNFLLQGLLHLAGYFLGGMLIGVVSPSVRILEPAVGAFLAVGVMLSMAFFTPYQFIQFEGSKLWMGGAIAFALALMGARIGERFTGHRG
jgi:hypothetical protein